MSVIKALSYEETINRLIFVTYVRDRMDECHTKSIKINQTIQQMSEEIREYKQVIAGHPYDKFKKIISALRGLSKVIERKYQETDTSLFMLYQIAEYGTNIKKRGFYAILDRVFSLVPGAFYWDQIVVIMILTAGICLRSAHQAWHNRPEDYIEWAIQFIKAKPVWTHITFTGGWASVADFITENRIPEEWMWTAFGKTLIIGGMALTGILLIRYLSKS